MALRLAPNVPVPVVVGAGVEVVGEFVVVVMVGVTRSLEALVAALRMVVLMSGTPLLGFVCLAPIACHEARSQAP